MLPTKTQAMDDAKTFRAEAILKNGTPAIIRAIRPEDRGRIRAAFEKLEPQTIFTRFFSRKTTLTDLELTDATEVDFENTVALVATLSKDGEEEVIAGGRYIAFEGTDGEKIAEVAFTVEDVFQGQGLASRMLAHLAEIARSKGIVRFEAEVLPHNAAMLKVFENSGFPVLRRSVDDVVHVVLRLPEG